MNEAKYRSEVAHRNRRKRLREKITAQRDSDPNGLQLELPMESEEVAKIYSEAVTVYVTHGSSALDFRIGPKRTPPEQLVFLSYFLPKRVRGALLGDIEELYPKIVERFGLKKAKVWATWTLLAAVWPLFRKELGHFAKILSKFQIK